ncbi:hypothetical protein F9L33_11825 [Amylibacter sp. SFDW26]|uniref:hypothetical protein n=1 Tax=Amylibacter sp. SFDW26 TaxID=2652722 RepID=UPI001261D220|nr:hypothetical protein [Amylibacter sp. SFDW26]KAB7613289.1 hypothetical protein F9L33_11825 [Amylibacter sp. SFDW26]
MKPIKCLALVLLAGCAPPNLNLDQNFNFREISYSGPLDDATNNDDGVITGITNDNAVKAAVLPQLKAKLSTFKGEKPYAFDIKCRVQLPTKFSQTVNLLTNVFLICEYGIKDLSTKTTIVEDRPVSVVTLVTPGKTKNEMLSDAGVKLADAVKKDLGKLKK